MGPRWVGENATPQEWASGRGGHFLKKLYGLPYPALSKPPSNKKDLVSFLCSMTLSLQERCKQRGGREKSYPGKPRSLERRSQGGGKSSHHVEEKEGIIQKEEFL